MKEGSSIGAGTLCYGTAVRGRKDPVLPEDAGLSLRRNKPQRSRFDMEFPPGSQKVNKWDSEDLNPHTNRQSILEDYLMEDEETSNKHKPDEPDKSRLGQWKSISDESSKKGNKKEPPVPPPSKPPDTISIPPTGWQQVQQVAPVSTIPPPGFAYGQPPPNYDQSSFYQYDYQQQQQQQHYAGYNYYQGYPDYSQGWNSGAEQPPPPGLMLPDMSQPPPMAAPVVSQPVPPPASSPVPTPAPVQTSQPVKKQASPELVERKEKDNRKGAAKKDHKEQEKELLRQRDEYVLKSSVLSKELDLLQEQKILLISEGASQNSYILKENNKLQEEIKNKLVAIKNVIEMLTGLTGSSKGEHRSEKHKRSDSVCSSGKEKTTPNPEIEYKSGRVSSTFSSPNSSAEEEPEGERINYSFYDPEEHWCRVCDVFPATAKEYLNHLQSEAHKDTIVQKKLADLPWHNKDTEKERPHYRGAPTRRVPIKGLQFFIAPTAWYCKLCDAWIGDLHCASIHLKAAKHMENYEKYIEKNPNWEAKWSAERKTAMSRTEEEDRRIQELMRVRQLVDDEDISMPRLESTIRMKEAWGDMSESPSHIRESLKITVANDEIVQDPEDMSRSIRVTMRNKDKPKEPAKPLLPPMGPALPPSVGSTPPQKKIVDTSSIPVPPVQSNGSTQGHWVVKSAGIKAISDSEKQLVKNLKDKYSQKQEKEDFHKREERSKEKRKERRFRERSIDRERSRSRSRGRDHSRERDYGDRGRSRSRDRRRRRRSSSPRRGRSRSRTPDRKSKKIETKQWVAPPSSPPPYLQRKNDEKEKWDKPKKKAQPNPVSSMPKSKLPFIGRMPTLKNRKKTSDDDGKSEPISDTQPTTERRVPEDMEIDSGASDNEEPTITITLPSTLPEVVPPPEEEEAPAEPAKPAPGDIPLPKDFQDALSILFPEDMPPEEEEEEAVDEMEQIPLRLPLVKKPVCSISQEELMMLGIDPEDEVAQGLSKN